MPAANSNPEDDGKHQPFGGQDFPGRSAPVAAAGPEWVYHYMSSGAGGGRLDHHADGLYLDLGPEPPRGALAHTGHGPDFFEGHWPGGSDVPVLFLGISAILYAITWVRPQEAR